MSAKIIANLTKNLLITKDGFEKRNEDVVKRFDLNGEIELVVFRQKNDRIELINSTQNILMTEFEFNQLDDCEIESVALSTYAEVKKSILPFVQQNDFKKPILVKLKYNDLFTKSQLRYAQFIVSNSSCKFKAAAHEVPENFVRLSIHPVYDRDNEYEVIAQHNIYDPIKDDYRIIHGAPAFLSIGINAVFDLKKIYNQEEISQLMNEILSISNLMVAE